MLGNAKRLRLSLRKVIEFQKNLCRWVDNFERKKNQKWEGGSPSRNLSLEQKKKNWNGERELLWTQEKKKKKHPPPGGPFKSRLTRKKLAGLDGGQARPTGKQARGLGKVPHVTFWGGRVGEKGG